MAVWSAAYRGWALLAARRSGDLPTSGLGRIAMDRAGLRIVLVPVVRPGPGRHEPVTHGGQPGFTAAHHRIDAWFQAFAACRQKSRISAGGVGPAICSWLSKMVTMPVDASMCAAVP